MVETRNKNYLNFCRFLYTVDVSKLDINKFTWDDDYILNKYGWNKAVDKFDKVIESLDLWRSIVYLDNIPNSLIIKYDFDYSN